MDWYKQRVGYYFELPMVDAGEEAEVLHLRAKSYAAHIESGGYIPLRALPLITPRRPQQRADKLVEVGLWELTAGGYRIVDWDEDQAELEALAGRRRADRERKRAQRDRSADSSRDGHVTSGGTGHVTNLSIRELEREEEKELKDSPSSAAADDARSDSKPKPKRKTKPRVVPPRFDEFWKTYPRRVGKIAAEQAFAKAVEAGADPQAVIDGALVYAFKRKGQDPEFTAHPTTWLNQGRWEDEAPPPPPAPSSIETCPVHRLPTPCRGCRADAIADGDDPWDGPPSDPFGEPPF
jgi:hypothetical protein